MALSHLEVSDSADGEESDLDQKTCAFLGGHDQFGHCCLPIHIMVVSELLCRLAKR